MKKALFLAAALLFTGCGTTDYLRALGRAMTPGGGHIPANTSAAAWIDDAVVCSQPERTYHEPGGAWVPGPSGDWCSARVCVEPAANPPSRGDWTVAETCGYDPAVTDAAGARSRCWDVHAPPKVSGASRRLLSEMLCEARVGQHLYLDGPLPSSGAFVPIDINFKGLVGRR